jgi:predicted nuclease of predicted toxin-antitoxin system
MIFKIDENLPEEAAEVLRASGHDADTVAEEDLSGTSDVELSLRIRQENRALVTLDLDFSNIQAYPPTEYDGIIVIRARSQDKHSLLSLVRKFIPLLTSERLQGKLWIVEPDRIRIR